MPTAREQEEGCSEMTTEAQPENELIRDFQLDVFDQSDLAFCIIRLELDQEGNPFDWTFAYANGALAKIDGLPYEGLVGKRFYDVFPKGDRKWLSYYYRAAFEGETLSFERICEEIGMYQHVSCWPTGHRGYCACILRDIREEALERENTNLALQEALVASERASAAKTAFLSSMSHDIRTPMNAIIGMTALAAAHLGDDERVSDCLKKISLSSKHLLSLINEVLDMSKIETGSVVLSEDEFNLSELLDSLVIMINQQLETKAHHFSVSSKDLIHEYVIGDSLRIQQIFVNVMSNAIKYTPDGGKISLKISEKPSNQAKVACYEFAFEDNGIGMDEEYLQHVFEPFSRADDAVVTHIQGTGLGMPISRNIARLMGGDVVVESKKGVGSRFTVTIRLKLQDREVEDDFTSFVDLDVLVADDDRASLDSTCHILDGFGMKTTGTTSGSDAVELTVAQHEAGKDFFACILDWKMPDVDGVEATRRIRAAVGEDVPIIIVSAYDWSTIEKEAREAGANAFVTKPLFRSRLARTFHAILDDATETITTLKPIQRIEKANGEGKRALLVEDNLLNSEIAKEILEMGGLEVECAYDGAEAVDLVSTCPDGYYDIVFMDIQMPKMNGNDATRAIRAMKREWCRTVPIIAMTANAFAEDVQAAKTIGMNEHIAKPLDLSRLATVLNKWLP